MADEDKDSKTEDPTEKRLSKAREEGDVPTSEEVKSLVVLVAGVIIVGLISPWMMSRLKEMLSVYLGKAHDYPMDLEGVRGMFLEMLLNVAVVLALPMGVTILAAFLSSAGQFGLIYTPKKLAPKLSTLNPITGVNKVFSKQKIADLIKQVIKISLVAAIAVLVIVPMIPHPDTLMDKPAAKTLEDLHWLLFALLVTVVVAYSAVAMLDLVWTRYQYTSKLKMTKQEVKDEHKQSEGDPTVKGRIRSLRLQRARQRMMASVPRASVVVTNPTHYAVALEYNMDAMAAPKVVAKGMDFVAARIREIAEEHDIPIVENPPLARALHAAVDLDEEIPQEHYKAVAELIGYVMRMDKGWKPSKGKRATDTPDNRGGGQRV